jgi:hypothetical protein
MIFYPPLSLLNITLNKSVFLAGTIEMGNSEDWQAKASNRIHSELNNRVNILNPRRTDWDSTWEQKIDSPYFYRQVDWELKGLEVADYILMYFDPSSKSPISLLELGLYARSGKLLVACPGGFWRKGNIEMICEKFGILLFEQLNEAIDYLIYKIQN